MGADDADGTLVTDTSGFSISVYKEWYNAKYGKLSVKMFDKMAILQSLHGKICAVDVMDGNANDSPSLRRLLPFLPQGTGSDVLTDSAYANRLLRCRCQNRKNPNNQSSQTASSRSDAYAQMLRF